MAAANAAPLFNAMKRFVVFIMILLLLIVSEYYFLTEFFGHKRVPVIAFSLTAAILCLFYFIRFFKRSVISS